MSQYRAAQKHLERLKQAKEALRKEQAQLPYEQKVAIVLRLQQLAREVAKVREQLRRRSEKVERKN